MKFILPLAFFLCGCVATQRHVERGDEIVYKLAYELALMHPDNVRLQNIARDAHKHSETGAGFDFAGIFQQILAEFGGLPGILGMLGIVAGGGGLLSPGLGMLRRRAKSPTEEPRPPPTS